MAKRTIDFNAVREIALALPEVEESTIHGAPSLKLRGRLLACPALHKSAEPDTLAVRIDVDQRHKLVAADTDVYYVTDHYVDYPAVLVRMARISRKSLTELLQMAWTSAAAKRQATRKKAGSRRRLPRKER